MQTPSLNLQAYSASTSVLATLVRPSRGIFARNAQAPEASPMHEARLPPGCHGVVDVRLSSRCPPARLQVQTCRCPQARLQVHRCLQTWLRACTRRPGSRCNHSGTRRPGSRCKLAGAYHSCLMLSGLGVPFLATVLMLLPTSRVSTRCTRFVCAL